MHLAPALPAGAGSVGESIVDDGAQCVRMQAALRQQRTAFASQSFPTAAQRRAKLRSLVAALRARQNDLVEAIHDDFTVRPRTEIRMIELMGPVLEARHAISHLGRWMRGERRAVELLFLGNGARVEYQPKGVVGIIAPWNLPAYLSLGPLIAALAAGNRAMLKVSETTPCTFEALRSILAGCFAQDEVAVFCGGPQAGQFFSGLAFDHLVFTGSAAVGRQVMRAASHNLVPVTLELGGKCPAIVGANADLADCAMRIAHGKAFNAGQVCVSPDYALVPRGRAEIFAEAVAWSWQQLVPILVPNPDYTSIINDAHAARLSSLLEDARDQGARIVACSRDEGGGRRLPLHLVLGATPAMRVMQEEIFGPILPVLEVEDLDGALAHVRAGERPLALYAFGLAAHEKERVLRETHSGGVTFDDWGWHAFQHDLPFGGIGASGQGSYHGVEGFRALSHARAVFRRRAWFPISLFYPPYGRLVQRLALRLYLGARPRAGEDGRPNAAEIASGARRAAR
jgi:coniferyl-aldehyde dehydrogenase